jgi:hypothetical protein
LAAFWQRWFGAQKQRPASLTLADYAENYLRVFQVGSQEEKTRHAAKLFEAANDVARHVGAIDFVSLIESSNVVALGNAAVYSRERFDQIATPLGDYWSSAYALTHLMILNNVKSIEDSPRAKQTAENAAYLYAAECGRRRMS